jgi:hypothetical protein
MDDTTAVGRCFVQAERKSAGTCWTFFCTQSETVEDAANRNAALPGKVRQASEDFRDLPSLVILCCQFDYVAPRR